MEKRLIKNSILVVLVLIGSNVFCQQGSNLPFTFPPPISEANIKGRPEYINYVLMSGISYPTSEECRATWDIFFFRVNGKNKNRIETTKTALRNCDFLG